MDRMNGIKDERWGTKGTISFILHPSSLIL
jgi:hypothetical protein